MAVDAQEERHVKGGRVGFVPAGEFRLRIVSELSASVFLDVGQAHGSADGVTPICSW